MDIATLGGFIFAIACILGGQALEGGHASSLVQATAAIIVIGGTMGATAVAFPMSDFIRGLKMAGAALKQKKSDVGALMESAFAAAALRVVDYLIALSLDLPRALYDTVAMTVLLAVSITETMARPKFAT